MKLSTSHLLFAAMAIGNIVTGELPSQLTRDLGNLLTVTDHLKFHVSELHDKGYDDKSQIYSVTHDLEALKSSIDALKTSSTSAAVANGTVFSPVDGVQLISWIEPISGNTTEWVGDIVTKTYFCQSFGLYIDSNIVPAKETINDVFHSLNNVTPDPLKAQLELFRTAMTDAYYKVLVYRNYYHNFDRPCIPWGTWNK